MSEEKEIIPDLMRLSKRCPVCKIVHAKDLPREGVKQWMEGALVQEALPNTSVVDREFLVSGVCSDECWSKLWA